MKRRNDPMFDMLAFFVLLVLMFCVVMLAFAKVTR